jgi:hypothetical protein
LLHASTSVAAIFVVAVVVQLVFLGTINMHHVLADYVSTEQVWVLLLEVISF